MTPKTGKAIAWLSFLLGIGVSIAGNIGHAASDGMKPGEWAGAAFWPMALMLTIEILTRVRWQPGKRWTAARVAGLVLVALVAAVLSYRHLAGLMTYWGEDWANAHLGPLAVDGLMLVAATALLSISKEAAQPEETEISTAPERDWSDSSQVLVADPEYLAQLDPQEDDVDDVDGPELPPLKSKPETSKLHVVRTVSDGDAEEAALQAWLDSGRKLSSQQVADLAGLSKSTAHRRIKLWERQIVR